jgi:hypothetical protein
MASRISDPASTWRLRLGESMLAAAQSFDTSPVKARFAEFERTHQEYAEAHLNVEGAEAHLRTVQMELTACDRVHNKAITALAGALISEGQPIVGPFAAYGGPPIRPLIRLPRAQKTHTVHELVTVMQRDGSLGEATLKAAKAADTAARAVEEAFVPVSTLRKAVRDARKQRDTKALSWDRAFACLKYDARAVARAGTPEIYRALFGRPGTKSTKAAANSPPVTAASPATPADPTPPDTDASKAA